jgi:hypothetical protein
LTSQWSPNRRTDNTMVKRKRTRGTSDLQTEGQTIQWSKEKGQEDNQWSPNRRTDNRSLVPHVLFLLTIVLSVLLFGDHWLSSCPFSFDHSTSDLQTEGQIIQWSKEKGQEDNQWSPNRRTDNTIMELFACHGDPSLLQTHRRFHLTLVTTTLIQMTLCLH